MSSGPTGALKAPGGSSVSVLETGCFRRDNEHRPAVAVEHRDDSTAANGSIAVPRGACNLILTLDPAAFRAAVIFVNAQRRAGSEENRADSSFALTMATDA